MMHPHTRAARTLLTVTTLVAGCNVFDAQLYKNVAPDQGMTGQNDGGPNDGSIPGDLAMVDPDAGGYLCGRSTPATLCSPTAGYIFCDGFETESDVSFPIWNEAPIVQGAGGPLNLGTALVVDDSPVCLGQKSLHATTVGATQQAFLFEKLTNRPSTLHVRFQFYIKQYSMQPFQIVGFSVSGNMSPNDYATLNVDPISHSLNYATGFNGVAANFNTPSIPTNQWICLELTTHFDQKAGELDLALDGKMLGKFTGQTDPSDASLDQVNVGLIYTAPGDTGTNDIFIDEVAISDQPIGCL